MTRLERLERELLERPRTFRFADFERIMRHRGFEVEVGGATSGSRIRFFRPRDARHYSMHVPHPSREMTGGAVRFAAEVVMRLREDDDEEE